MIIICYILLAAASTTGYRYMSQRENVSGPKSPNYIVGIKDIPHHALVVYGTKFCSGSLITSKTVLTTASCFMQRNNKQNIIVKFGASTMTDFGQMINVVETKIHEYFQRLCEWDNDVALLHLEGDVEFDKVQKALIVEPDVAIRVNTPIMVSGWGSGNLPVAYLSLLLQSEMIVLDRTLCQNVYGGQITPSNFCVKYSKNQLLSDNGGGALLNDYLVGILSAGGNTPEHPRIAILTNVSYFYRWIKFNTRYLLKKYCVAPTSSHKQLFESYEDDGGTK